MTILSRTVLSLALMGALSSTVGCAEVDASDGDAFESAESALVAAPTVNPNWKVLVLVYRNTDYSYVDANGKSRRVVGKMTESEALRSMYASNQFFYSDVPLLTSGNMVPTVEVRFIQEPVKQLYLHWGSHLSPSASTTAVDRDPSFDSVIAIWKDTGIDQYTGETINLLPNAGGLADDQTGTGQTFAALPVSNISMEQRNLLKHEWGHSIVMYHERAGSTASPSVWNHINDTDTRYVHCKSNREYTLVDETDQSPVVNSIYNNHVGFTHDYFSGTTAVPSDPSRCIGINADAWLRGGPVTKPSSAGGLTTAVTITDDWVTGYCAELKVTNTSKSAANGWTVGIVVSGTVNNAWNLAYEQTGRTLTVAGRDSTANLLPGQSTTAAGFCATRS